MFRVPALALLFAMPAQPAAPGPLNLDFSSGTAKGWSLTPGYTAAVSAEACALIQPGAGAREGNLAQTFDAATWRGKTVRLSAWLHLDRADPASSAQLWIRQRRPGGTSDFFGNRGDIPVRTVEWTQSEVSMQVATDAVEIEIGVLAKGSAGVGVRGVSFSLNDVRGVERDVITYETAGEIPAAQFRGKTVNLRGRMKLAAGGEGEGARFWLRVADQMEFRDAGSKDWTEFEITRKIPEDASSITYGMVLRPGRSASLEVLSVRIVEERPSPLVQALARAAKPEPVPAVTGLPTATIEPGGVTAYAEQVEIINRAARRAAAYSQELPNFLCTQIVVRTDNRGSGWKPRDILTVQLGYADGTEHYKLAGINNRPTNLDYRAVGGAFSEGDFGSSLLELFRPAAAKFLWEGKATLRGHPVEVFSYRIPLEKSSYNVQIGVRGSNATAAVAHHGSVYIDADKGQVLRIVRNAEQRPGFPLRSAITILDYDLSAVGGHMYLLPLKAQITMSTDRVETRNEVDYRDYKRFEAETKVTFDPQ